MTGLIRLLSLQLMFGLSALLTVATFAAADTIRIGGTTSVRESGLLAALETAFQRDTGHQLQFIVGGTGRVLKLLEAQDVSGALVHDTDSERALLDAGGAAQRFDVMRNDYLILGPRDADVPTDVIDLFRTIAARELPFVSRGDNSGTHRAELRIWSAAGVDIEDPAARSWYRKSGSGQGATLNIAASLDAFVLADAATWIAFDNKADLMPNGCRGAALRNVYGVLLGYDAQDVDDRGERFARWLLGPGQAVIETFKVRGQAPFVPVSQADLTGSLPVVEGLCTARS